MDRNAEFGTSAFLGGLSDKPPGVASYRVDTLAADIAALIRQAGSERAIVVGHDWGGIVAWHLAMHPDPQARNPARAIALAREAAAAAARSDLLINFVFITGPSMREPVGRRRRRIAKD